MGYWKRVGLIGVIGIIPEGNKKAKRMIKLYGWKFSGIIPDLCDMKYKGTGISKGVRGSRDEAEWWQRQERCSTMVGEDETGRTQAENPG